MVVVDDRLVVLVDLRALAYVLRLLRFRKAYIHRAGFDALDEALRNKRNDIVLVVEIERSILHSLEQRLQAIGCGCARIDQRLDLIVKVDVADVVKVDTACALLCCCYLRCDRRRRRDNKIICAVDTRIHIGGSEHGLKQNSKPPSIVGRDRLLKEDVRIEHSARQRIVHLSHGGLILCAMTYPDEVQVRLLGKGTKKREHVDHLICVRRHLRLIGGGGQLRRWCEIECERDVLRKV